MNILFIDPPFKRFTGFSNPYFPVGLAYLSAVCNQNGHSAVVYEVDAQEKTKTIDMDFSHEHQKLELYKQAVNDVTNPIWEEIIQTVQGQKPDVIGITIMTTKIASAIRTVRILKENFSDIPIIVGGPHATLIPEQCFKVDSIDYVMQGESERTILSFLSFIAGALDIKKVNNLSYRDSLGKIVHNEPEKLIETLDEIPFPDRESLLYLPNYSSEDLGIIMATRGCPYGCTYCAHMFGRRVRKRSVENVLDEMLLLKKKYGAIQISFKDDTFTVDKEWTTELCHKLIEIDCGINWDCTTRVDTVDETLIKLMKKAGCNDIRIGIETGSQRILDETKKGITFNQVKSITKKLNKNRMMWTGYFMYGLPSETVEDIQSTYTFMQELNPNYAGLGLYNPFPRTELFDQGIKLGLLEENVDIDYFFKTNPKDYYFKDPTKRVSDIEPDEFKKIEIKIQEAFDLHNKKISNLARRAISRRNNYVKHPKILIHDLVKGFRMTKRD